MCKEPFKEALNKYHFLIIRHSDASQTKSPGAILNSFSWPATRAYTMEGICNPAITINYWMLAFACMTAKIFFQSFLKTIDYLIAVFRLHDGRYSLAGLP
jgi:hypothetical protein